MTAEAQEGAGFFSEDYASARRRFRDSAEALGASVSAIPISGDGPGGLPLTIEVARLGPADADRLLIVSSGLHGVEGFFGSAAQLAWMSARGAEAAKEAKASVLLLHGLCPYGFAWLRRFDGDNIDSNRNFLLNGETYAGAPPRYAALDPLLNPKGPPGFLDEPIFLGRASLSIARWGMPALKQAVAGGQYDYPLGLFYGGSGPSELHRALDGRIDGWVGPAVEVRHVDFHTGLGPWATHRLLVDNGQGEERLSKLRAVFDGDRVDAHRPNAGVFYDAKGDINRWMRARLPDRDVISVCAEFGTYPPLKVLGALRAENRAHLHLPEEGPGRDAAKRRCLEAFAPRDPSWRDTVVRNAVSIIEKARVMPN